jgi:hypothetical protein
MERKWRRLQREIGKALVPALKDIIRKIDA